MPECLVADALWPRWPCTAASRRSPAPTNSGSSCRMVTRIGRKRKRAAGVGFEPTDELPRQRFSRPPDSTALAPRRPLSVCTSRGGDGCSSDPRERSLGSAAMSAASTGQEFDEHEVSPSPFRAAFGRARIEALAGTGLGREAEPATRRVAVRVRAAEARQEALGGRDALERARARGLGARRGDRQARRVQAALSEPGGQALGLTRARDRAGVHEARSAVNRTVAASLRA